MMYLKKSAVLQRRTALAMVCASVGVCFSVKSLHFHLAANIRYINNTFKKILETFKIYNCVRLLKKQFSVTKKENSS